MQATVVTITGIRYIRGDGGWHPYYRFWSSPAVYMLNFEDCTGQPGTVNLRDFFRNNWGIFTARRQAALDATRPQSVSVTMTEEQVTVNPEDLQNWLGQAQAWLAAKPKGWKPEPKLLPPLPKPARREKALKVTTVTLPSASPRPCGAKTTCRNCGKVKLKKDFRKGQKGKTCRACERHQQPPRGSNTPGPDSAEKTALTSLP